MSKEKRATRVLVVDDELITAFALSVALVDEGYEVLTAASSQEALKIGEEFKPDILVSDWHSKDGNDGLGIAKAIREKNPHLQTILVTGLSAYDLEIIGGLSNIQDL